MIRLDRLIAIAALVAIAGLAQGCAPAVIPLARYHVDPPPTLSPSIGVVLDPALAGDPAVAVAVEHLEAALERSSLDLPAVWDGGLPPAGSILVLAADSPAAGWAGVDRRVPEADESYWIGTTVVRDRPVVAVAGRGAAGAAYGAIRLADLIDTGGPGRSPPADLAVSPAFTFRLTGDPLDPNYPSPEEALIRGYNAVLIDPWPELALYDTIDPRIYDPDAMGAERARVEAKRARTRARIAAAKRLHLRVVVLGDLITLPRRVADLYGPAVGLVDERPTFCLDRPAVRDLVAASLDEVLTEFPEIDAVLVRAGENYAGGFLAGNPPHRAAGCAAEAPATSLRRAIDLVRSVVVDRHGRVYIHRAWDLGAETFHGDPTLADSVLEGLPADDRLRFSFKHTRTDFWRYNEPNPNLGNRGIARQVELQAAREYEGKGAFPDFIGGIIGRGSPETRSTVPLADLVDQGVRSVWVWPKGGGWGGPALSDDLWVDANRYALDHLIWEPDLSSIDLARAWATSRFGAEAAPVLAALLDRSPDIVLRAFYPRAAGRESDGWLPNQNWIRDDLVAGADYLGPMYEAARRGGQVEATIADSAAARAEIEGWLRLLDAPPPGVPPERWAPVRASLRYQASLQAALDDYLAGVFYFFRWRDGGYWDAADRDRAAARLRSAEAGWRRHQDIAAADGFATPYRDAGMLASVGALLKEMGGDPAGQRP